MTLAVAIFKLMVQKGLKMTNCIYIMCVYVYRVFNRNLKLYLRAFVLTSFHLKFGNILKAIMSV